MIEFKNVNLTYKTNSVVALDDVSVTINDGEFVFVVGASGAGKSSFLNVIMGQEHVDSGVIRVGPYNLNGIKNRDLPYLRRMLGIVFQDFRLIPKMTVYDNVAFALRVIGMGEKRIAMRVQYVLKLVDLSDKLQMFPHQLSTGERQRVAIARALVNNPSVIIADEPTGNLDPVLSSDIMDLFDKINSLGATVIVVTHDLELVHQFDHRIVTIEKGRLVSDIPSSANMRLNNNPSAGLYKEEQYKSNDEFNYASEPEIIEVRDEDVFIPEGEAYASIDETSLKYVNSLSDVGEDTISYNPAPVPDFVPASIDDTDYHAYLEDEDDDSDGKGGENDE